VSGLLDTICFQNLVPKLCLHCRRKISREHPEYDRLARTFGEKIHNVHIKNKTGCNNCSSGHRGRTVIAEVVKMDSRSCELISNGDYVGWEKHLKSNGWKAIKEHAKHKVLAGIVDPIDAEERVKSFSFDHDKPFDYRSIGD